MRALRYDVPRMDQRGNQRTQCAVEVEVSRLSSTSRGSLIDLSSTGFQVNYLPADTIRQLAIGDTIVVSGVIPTGTFRIRGIVRRLEPEKGELGAEIQGGDGDDLVAIHKLLSAPLAGTNR